MALTHVDLMREDGQGRVMDQFVVDAVCMRLSAGVEVLNRLDASVRTGLFGDSWTFMWGMRNRIAHGYLLIDPAIIRRTLETDIPTIMRQIHRALGEDPGRSRNPRSGG
ncbi:HepT-like ribonuclease domain-containing protein [Lapillicoccus sp.]|uniref:HepT-like ribonuclease domain-containing protein n=1 Tax=Lapillicoccus sp. TaxID=1909287 RepID=UPI0025DDF81D|nr:HepT-like ribonuclease domain-containing protein [Lapillicoccus sp.]